MSAPVETTVRAIPRPVGVLVAGGGMAGVFAALGARSRGAEVCVLEPHNVLGGQGTAGGVAGFCGDTARVNRPFAQLVETLARHELIAPLDAQADRRPYELDAAAFLIQEAVAAAGVKILFHTRAIGAEQSGGCVKSVLASTSSGLVQFRPRFVLDTTGDCFLAGAAGFPLVREGALKQLPMSLYFTLWDTGKAVRPFLPPGCPQWHGDDDLPMTTLHCFDSGKVEVKMKVVGFDAADGESLSAAELHARRQMMGLLYHLQTKGYRGRILNRHVLAGVSRQIGVREGGRIVGEHVLSEDEVKRGARFPDAVAVGTYHLDFHWPDRVERAGTGITTMIPPYHIPLRCLVPRGARNLLVAGRGASGDQMAMSSFRVMATCAQMGFAAGLTAAHCLAGDTDLRGLDLKALQADLAAQGQSLELADYGEYLSANALAAEAK